MLGTGAPPADTNALTPPAGDDDVDYEDEDGDNEEDSAQDFEGSQEDGDRKSDTDSIDPLLRLEDEGLNGSVQGRNIQPVITQQIIGNLIINQSQSIIQPSHAEGEGWEEKKKSYSRLLDGYESPTGGAFRATLELGSLMFAAVAAESANQISLMAQHDANEKLVKQAERHREIMEKEFTENLARIKMENQRTIDETIRIRDEFVQMCKPTISVEDDYLRRIDGSQSPQIMRMRLDVMSNKIARCKNEIFENEERHAQELKQEKTLTAIKDQDLLRQRKKIRELQSIIREYEENLLRTQPASKKIKVEDQGLIKAVAVEDQHLPVKARALTDQLDKRTTTSAYAESSHHQRNLAIVLKKDSSIKSPKNLFTC